MLFQLILVLSIAEKKQGFFIDEILSYILSNSYYREMYSPSWSLYNTWTMPDYFNNLVMVPTDHTFTYKSVIFNQSVDVHPPLYYLILHTICSFFPESFSKWYGLLINIVLMIISNVLLYLVCVKLYKNDFLALIPCIIWGFSAGAISTVIFIRMYMLLSVILLAFIYSHLQLFYFNNSPKYLITVFFLTTLGFLTHYYFLIFLFFMSGYFVMYWVLVKNLKVLVRYVFVILSGITIGLLIFPNSLNHILRSYRGVETFANFVNFPDFFIRIKSMFFLLSQQQFSGLLLTIILVLIFVFTIDWIKDNYSRRRTASHEPNHCLDVQESKNKINKAVEFILQNTQVLSLMTSVIATFVVISFISPYLKTRYFYFIYPVITLLLFYFLYQILNRVFISSTQKDKYVIYGALVFLLMLNILSIHHGQIEYVYPEYKHINTITQKYQDYDCIYITDRAWIIDSNVFELSNFQRTYVTKSHDILRVEEIRRDNNDKTGLILVIDNELDENDILNGILLHTGFTRHETLYTQEFSSTYFIH